MIATLEDVQEFAKSKLEEAREGSATIPFHVVERYGRVAKSASGREILAESRVSITDEPKYAVLKHGTGLLAHAVVLSVDLRHSTSRAMQNGARDTYLTMHTFMPTMAYVVEKSGGSVIGLRGDGLFAGFGVTEVIEGEETFTPEIAKKAAGDSTTCARGMIEAVTDAINPLFGSESLAGNLRIGVGLDSGPVVITRIGLETANEVTAYGPCVNNACKLSGKGNNEIYMSKLVNDFYPTTKDGKVRIRLVGGVGYRVDDYPFDVLARKGRRHPK